MRIGTTVLAALILLAAGAASAAEPPPPGGIPDLVGARTLGLSSGIGVAQGNDGIYVNPAALAARKRYSVDGSVLFDRRGATTVDQFFGGSVVDSTSGPMTAAVAYARSGEGLYQGNLWTSAIAGPLVEKFLVGVAGKYYSLHGPQPVNAATLDAGIFWQAADYVSIGATGYNLIPIAKDLVAPMGVGAGLAIGSEQLFQVTADWRADFDRGQVASGGTGKGGTKNRYGFGAELLLGSLVPVRGGFLIDEVLDTKWWSVGTGLVSRSGIALDVGYRQSVDSKSARQIAASLRIFLFQ
ncbi:hypothetical protein [Anaeromyxobacter oryzae]|uniref:Uncharacterized protein n=1 Tax=Anaeromyxobacter oryzae TaxID=2918170 RepID=A0ABM7WRU8_9BACT|nr:hypothetical protein [Anaeromyxobacter oryzae]BDG02181.1 hypothetical protein AMOR_11770 [Anaeromyxobacter oryzae]